MAKSIINSVNSTGVLEEHEQRIDALEMVATELLGLIDDLNDKQRGKNERSKEFVETMENALGALGNKLHRASDRPEFGETPRAGDGPEKTPDTLR